MSFDDTIIYNNNRNNDIINNIIIDKLKIKCKENMNSVKQNNIVDLFYVDPFNYKFTVIT
jgi:hypothetical protein